MTVIARVKYLPDLRATVIKISSFSILLKKNENGTSDILYHGVRLSPSYFVLLYRVGQKSAAEDS